MTTLALAGAVAGFGVFLLVRQLMPAHPRLDDSITRLDPTNLNPTFTATEQPSGLQYRIGSWTERTIGARLGVRPPAQDLAILGRTTAQFYADKLRIAAIFAIGATVLSLALSALGFAVAWQVPTIAVLGLGVAGWFTGDYDVRTKANEARAEFSAAVVTYIQLVAISRSAANDNVQAMHRAANISDGWMFRRIREELSRAALYRTPEWDALNSLAEREGIPELAEVAAILRLAGKQGASINDNLMAQADALRERQLTAQATQKNAATQTMTAPATCLGIVFTVLLGWPYIDAILAGPS